MNFIHQLLAAFNHIRVSTAFALMLAFAAVVLLDKCGVAPLAGAGTWAAPLATTCLIISIGVFCARAFQEVMAARAQARAHGLRFTRIEARFTPQPAPPVPMVGNPAQAYGLVVQCVCTTESESAKLMSGRVLLPKITSSTPVQILGTNSVSGQNGHEPRIRGGEVWQLTIATIVTFKAAPTWGQSVPLRLALIDERGKLHILIASAYVG